MTFWAQKATLYFSFYIIVAWEKDMLFFTVFVKAFRFARRLPSKIWV